MVDFLYRYKKAIFIILDAVLISLAIWLAFFLRFEGQVSGQQFLNMAAFISLAVLLSVPIFFFFRLYSFSWAYVSTTELIGLFQAVLLSFLIFTAVLFLFRDHPVFLGFPRSTLLIGFFLTFLFCGGIRFVKRLYLQVSPRKPGEIRQRTLIVGAGDAGEQILRNIASSKESPYLPVGFADDGPRKQGVVIHGLKVLGRIEDIPQLVKSLGLQAMIVAVPSAGSRLIRKAVEKGREAGLKKIKVVPPLTEIIDGEISIEHLKSPQMEDLLGRDPVPLDLDLIGSFISGRSVLITGAAGSIGSELCRQVVRFRPSRLLMLDQDETGVFNIEKELKGGGKTGVTAVVGDIRDEKRISRIFREFAPQIVFHAAAYKHVPLMEENPEEAVKTNVLGTRVVARAALESGTEKFVFISTDKAVNPTSVMGAAKRMGEMICQAFNRQKKTKFVSVRFGNVLDSRGSCIPIFREQIRRGGPVEITHPEMKRYFMMTSEACLLVTEAGAMGRGGEVFVLDMGKPVKVLDLAREMIKLSGLQPDKDIPIVFTGIRPGEKLFEEILTAEEGTAVTERKKVLRARLSDPDLQKVEKGVEELRGAAENLERKKILVIFKELIPTYEGGKNAFENN